VWLSGLNGLLSGSPAKREPVAATA